MATVKDFVTELELYPYSRTNYELHKECSELRLMEQFIENARFMTTNAKFISENAEIFGEGYFQESTDDNTIESITEAAGEKAKNIWRTVTTKAMSLLKRLLAFFGKIGEKIGNEVRIREINNKLKGITLDVDQTRAMIGLFQSSGDVKGNGRGIIHFNDVQIKIPDNQPFEKKLGVKYADSVNKPDQMVLNTYLAATLSTTQVRLIPMGSDMKAVSADALIKVLNGLVKGKKGYDFEGVEKMLNAAISDAKSKGLVIDCSADGAKRISDELDRINKKVSGMKGELGAEQDLGDIWGVDTPVVDSQVALLEKCNEVAAATIKLYSGYASYRAHTLTVIGNRVDTYATTPKQKAKKEKEAAERQAYYDAKAKKAVGTKEDKSEDNSEEK